MLDLVNPPWSHHWIFIDIDTVTSFKLFGLPAPSELGSLLIMILDVSTISPSWTQIIEPGRILLSLVLILSLNTFSFYQSLGSLHGVPATLTKRPWKKWLWPNKINKYKRLTNGKPIIIKEERYKVFLFWGLKENFQLPLDLCLLA